MNLSTSPIDATAGEPATSTPCKPAPKKKGTRSSSSTSISPAAQDAIAVPEAALPTAESDASLPTEIVLKAKLRGAERIVRYRQLLAESQMSQTEFIIDRCLNTHCGGNGVPIINIQAYHELGQCRVVFEELLAQMQMIEHPGPELAIIVNQLEQELGSIRRTRQSLINQPTPPHLFATTP